MTHYYYKEIPDETDPDKTKPVSIDTLFNPKPTTSGKVSGYLDQGKDLCDLFELCGTSPPASSFGVEDTHYKLDIRSLDLPSWAGAGKVLSVSKSNPRHIRTVTTPYTENVHPGGVPGGRISANQSVTIPADCRDRWMYCSSVINTEAPSGNTAQVIIRGGLVPPNTVTYQTNTPVLEGVYVCLPVLRVYLHEVEMVDSSFDPKEADLSDIFVANSKVMDSLDEWWKAPMLFTHGTFYNGINSTAATVSFPHGSFTFRGVGGDMDNTGSTMGWVKNWIGNTLKPTGTRSMTLHYRPGGEHYTTLLVGVPW